MLRYIRTNDEVLELQAALAGRCIGQLAGVTAAPYIRSGQLLPVLVGYMADLGNCHIHFGSRTSQPVRARAFIDLALARPVDNDAYVLGEEELAAGEQRAGTDATRLRELAQGAVIAAIPT